MGRKKSNTSPSIEERVAKIEKFMVHVEELLAKQ